ncbi:hypothetical protein PVAP13_2KG413905 [Panicum virgatum]|uniref:Uncharacterized protein n=1 Tax=Panicum virgatum TaxID=38727 RepID=A0A8T0WAY0_PANVG|nr:hypothetical protein PVAP13_2KG413905 [Panicum virgatum]
MEVVGPWTWECWSTRPPPPPGPPPVPSPAGHPHRPRRRRPSRSLPPFPILNPWRCYAEKRVLAAVVQWARRGQRSSRPRAGRRRRRMPRVKAVTVLQAASRRSATAPRRPTGSWGGFSS